MESKYKPIILIIALVLALSVMISAVNNEDELDNEIIGNVVLKGLYYLDPSFKVESDYNLNIYDIAKEESKKILDCSNEVDKSDCIQEVVKIINKDISQYDLKLKQGFNPDLNEDVVKKYGFTLSKYLHELAYADYLDETCYYPFNSLIGTKLIFNGSLSGSHMTINDDMRVDFAFDTMFELSGLFYDSHVLEIKNMKTFYVSKNGNTIVFRESVSDLPKCRLESRKNVFRNFYYEYENNYGEQYISFAMDLRTPPPPKISDFDLDIFEGKENAFNLKWEQVKTISGKKVDSLNEYRIYCSDEGKGAVLLSEFETVKADKEKYDIKITKCNGEDIVNGQEYYFNIVPVSFSNSYVEKGLLTKSKRAVDELAPGLNTKFRFEERLHSFNPIGTLNIPEPLCNADGSDLTNYDGYYVFYDTKARESELLLKIADLDSDFDCDNLYYCRKEKSDVESIDLKDLDLSLDFGLPDEYDFVFYTIPFDSDNNFINQPLEWAQDNPTCILDFDINSVND